VRLALVAVVAVAALAGYYALHKQGEHTNAFIRCLRQSGGTQITRPVQLRDYPSRDVQDGDGAAFGTLAYESIDVALPHHRRRELVLVEYPGDESDWPATPGDLLRQARHGHISGERALVLMPPTNEADLDTDIERCERRADPHQEYFHEMAKRDRRTLATPRATRRCRRVPCSARLVPAFLTV
jgi:hypothetical protein